MVAVPKELSGNQSDDGEQAEIQVDPVESAKMAGLRYITDEEPGIRRKRAGKHFRYVDVDGKPMRIPRR